MTSLGKRGHKRFRVPLHGKPLAPIQGDDDKGEQGGISY